MNLKQLVAFEVFFGVKQLVLGRLFSYIDKAEFTQISPLVGQIKVWPKGEAPRYFTVRISEAM